MPQFKDVELLKVTISEVDERWTRRVFHVQKSDYEEIKKYLTEMENRALIR